MKLGVQGSVLESPCSSPGTRVTTLRFALTGLLILSLFALPHTSAAQQARIYRVGVVLLGGPYTSAIDGLRDGLREVGLEEGKQVVLQVSDTKSDLTSVGAAARTLEGEKVDLIFALTTSVALATKRATKTVPIVFYVGTNPVLDGLVESFRKPGGRLTGVHGQNTSLDGKRLELLKGMIPRLRRIVTFYRPDSPAAQPSVKKVRDAAARQLKLELVERPVASVEELRAGLRALQPGDVDAIMYVPDAMVASQTDLIIESARAKRLPTMLRDRGGVAKGALAAYGESYYMIGRLAAKQVQRILLGANPADMPVEQLDRFYFVINLKTARALGLTIPQSMVARADEIIE